MLFPKDGPTDNAVKDISIRIESFSFYLKLHVHVYTKQQ